MAIIADLAQTIIIDSQTVKQSDYAYVTSVTLFFRGKPSPGSTSSGLPKPGVTVYICETNDENAAQQPNLSDYIRYGRARVEYDNIVLSSNPGNNINAAGTKFTFQSPVPIRTNRYYAVVVKFDGADTGFQLFRNKANETYNSTQASAVSAGAMAGKLFVLTNGNISTPLNDSDLMFRVNIAKFTEASKSYRLVNRNYEILGYDGTQLNGNFVGGEYVVINAGNPAGQTISTSTNSLYITGSNTTFLSTFADDDLIVLRSGNTFNVRRIVSRPTNTLIELNDEPGFTNAAAVYQDTVVARVFDHYPQANILALVSSTANATAYFANNTVVYGTQSGASVTINKVWDFRLNSYQPDFLFFKPSGTAVDGIGRFADINYDTQSINEDLRFNERNSFEKFEAWIASRSNEVQNIAFLENGKSVNMDLTLSTTNEYVSPILDEEKLKFDAWRWIANFSTTNEHLPNQGNAQSKYVSKRVTLAEGQDSEDIKVYVTAHRPVGTDIKTYIKFYNPMDPEGFEGKNWTELESLAPPNLLSNPKNKRDFVDLQFSLPWYPVNDYETMEAGANVVTTFQGTNGSAVFTRDDSSVSVNTHIIAGNVVRIFDPAAPDNSYVAVVTSSNTVSFTVEQTLSNSNTYHRSFIGTGKVVQVCVRPNSAFKNYMNGGVIRYYNTSGSAYDTYRIFALKNVLLTNNGVWYPLMNDVRAVAVTV